MIIRPQVSQDHIDIAFGIVRERLMDKIKIKGAGVFASPHESLGSLTEEYHEFIEAVHLNGQNEIVEELVDIAICSTFSIASILAIRGLDDSENNIIADGHATPEEIEANRQANEVAEKEELVCNFVIIQGDPLGVDTI